MQDELEMMIDKTSLSAVLEMLVNICHEKADHIRTNWVSEIQEEGNFKKLPPEEYQAREWEKAGEKIDKLTSKIDI